MKNKSIEDRLAQIENQYFRLKLLISAAGVFIALALLSGASGKAIPVELKANRFVLVDRNGQDVAVLSVEKNRSNGLMPKLHFLKGGTIQIGNSVELRGEDDPGLYLSDGEGTNSGSASLYIKSGRTVSSFLHLNGFSGSKVHVDTYDGRSQIKMWSDPYHDGSKLQIDSKTYQGEHE